MNQPWIIATPIETTFPVTSKPGGLAGLILGDQDGPPLTVEVFHTDGWGDEDWHPVSGAFVLLEGDQVRLTRTSEDAASTVLAVMDATSLHVGSTLPGPGTYVMKVDPDESRALTLSLPSGANGLHVRLIGGRGDIDLVLRNPSNQNQGSSRYAGPVTGNNEGFFVMQAVAGNWTVRLDEGRSAVASSFLFINYSPAGTLTESTLTTTDTPQALTIPPDAEMVRYTVASGSAQISADGGTNWTTYNAPVTYTTTPAQAAALLFKTSGGTPATINYLPYVRPA